MKISVTKDTHLNEIEDQFTGTYPFLKLDFYRNPGESPRPKKLEQVSQETRLKDLVSYEGVKTINMNGDITVTQFENDILENLGFVAKVKRQAGKEWVNTSYTCSWTLAEQNKEGNEFLDY